MKLRTPMSSMAKIPAHKRLVILDACESGAGASVRTRSLDRLADAVRLNTRALPRVQVRPQIEPALARYRATVPAQEQHEHVPGFDQRRQPIEGRRQIALRHLTWFCADTGAMEISTQEEESGQATALAPGMRASSISP
jgi:hypothetical protein